MDLGREASSRAAKTFALSARFFGRRLHVGGRARWSSRSSAGCLGLRRSRSGPPAAHPRPPRASSAGIDGRPNSTCRSDRADRARPSPSARSRTPRPAPADGPWAVGRAGGPPRPRRARRTPTPRQTSDHEPRLLSSKSSLESVIRRFGNPLRQQNLGRLSANARCPGPALRMGSSALGRVPGLRELDGEKAFRRSLRKRLVKQRTCGPPAAGFIHLATCSC